MDKKIIWEHTNYFRITSKKKRRPGLPDGAFSNLDLILYYFNIF